MKRLVTLTVNGVARTTAVVPPTPLTSVHAWAESRLHLGRVAVGRALTAASARTK